MKKKTKTKKAVKKPAFTEAKFNKLCKDLAQDVNVEFGGRDADGEVFYECAKSMLENEPGLKTFLDKRGIFDATSYLADEIYSRTI